MTIPEPMPAARFPLGRLGVTLAAGDALAAAGVDPFDLLLRHASGDWGIVAADDGQANDDAVRAGDRIFSAYPLDSDRPAQRVWIITEADRSRTLVLLPSEY